MIESRSEVRSVALGEFDLIRKYFSRTCPNAVLGVGDDAALVAPAPGMQLAIAADTMLEGRHFFAGTDPYAVGWKSLAVNLSDMAAMGAIPRWITLCLTLPKVDEAWLGGFSRGLYELAEQHGVDLIGGDTTRGPLTVSIQIIGEVEAGAALRRDAAKPGDDIWLSGPTGAANLAVKHRYGEIALNDQDLAHCAARLDLPVPRVVLGRALRGLAHAAIDVSDGLLADLGHIAQASSVAAVVELACLPLPPLSAIALSLPVWQAAQLTGGDDYEICFTAPVSKRDHIQLLASSLGLPIGRIGYMEAGEGVTVLHPNGQRIASQQGGFNHFEGV